ncbi:hypothetical protein Tco_0709588 [Tanacetum coccineum]
MKKIIDDASGAGGNRAGESPVLGDQDAQALFPVCLSPEQSRTRLHGSADLTKVQRQLETTHIKKLDLEAHAVRRHGEEVACLRGRIAELEAEVKHFHDDSAVAVESNSYNYDRANFYKVKEEKPVETLPLLVNRFLVQKSVMSLEAHILSAKICRDVPKIPKLTMKLLRRGWPGRQLR